MPVHRDPLSLGNQIQIQIQLLSETRPEQRNDSLHTFPRTLRYLSRLTGLWIVGSLIIVLYCYHLLI
jgi:hypothetical protein